MEDELFQRLSKITHFELPPIPCRIPVECHPDFTAICKEADEWATHSAKVDNSKARVQSRLSLLGSLCHPRADREKVLLATKHHWVLFPLDDLVERAESKEELLKIRDVIWNVVAASSSSTELDPCILCFGEVVDEFRRLMYPPTFQRYLKHFAHYLDCVVQEGMLRLNNIVPDVDEYRAIRRGSSGVEFVAAVMTEFCMGLELDEEVAESEDCLAFVAAVDDHVVLVNDLLSFRKEFYSGVSHNYVSIIFCHGTASFQQVVDRICEMIQEEEKKVLQLQKKLVDLGNATKNNHLVEYANCLPLFTSGNWLWSYVTGRYHGFDNPLLTGEPFHGMWCLHPEYTLILDGPLRCKDHPYLMVESAC